MKFLHLNNVMLLHVALFSYKFFCQQTHGYTITPTRSLSRIRSSTFTYPFISPSNKKHPSPSHQYPRYHQRNFSPLHASIDTKQESFTSKHIVPNVKVVASTTAILVLDSLFRKSFQAMSISFPSSLAGCTALFTFLLLVNAVNKEWGDSIHSLFNPGAILLAKWLPVFFVPSLVTLPLAPSLGSNQEVKKNIAIF